MDAKIIAILIVCIAAVLIAGCTTGPAPSGTATPTQSAPTPDVATAPVDVRSCASAEDCVPAQCCHPTGCINKAAALSCGTVMCTMSCEGPIDCGAGSCGCVNGVCSVVPVQGAMGLTGQVTSVKLEASPQRYSPMMSSTVGIRLTPVVSGFDASDAQFRWSASYGHFLSWKAPDFNVTDLGNPIVNNGESVYWSFVDKPALANDPVTITVTVKDRRTGAEIGQSMIILEWDGDYAVYMGRTWKTSRSFIIALIESSLDT